MRVAISQLTLPDKAAALNDKFKNECLRLGTPVFDSAGKLTAVDIGRIPLQQAFHKCMLESVGYRGSNPPPMFIELPVPQFIPKLPPEAFANSNQKGVGTELRQVLNEYGVTFSELYDFLVYKLNDKPIDECAEHLEDILDVLEDEAYRNKTVFERDRAEVMVRLAIRRARRNQNGG